MLEIAQIYHALNLELKSLLANFVSPVTILADSNCTFSSFATSRSKHPSHTSQAYSNVGLMKVRYIFDRRKLTTFYKMHNKVCPQYLCNCLPPTVSSISDHNLRNNENYTTPRNRLIMSLTSFIPSTASL
jgi:hypothetical protein